MPFHSNVSFPTLTYRLHKTTLPKLRSRVNQKFISEAREGLFFIFRDKLKITRLRERETECTVENWGNNIMLKTFWWHHSYDRDLFTCQHFQVRSSAKFKAPSYQLISLSRVRMELHWWWIGRTGTDLSKLCSISWIFQKSFLFLNSAQKPHVWWTGRSRL